MMSFVRRALGRASADAPCLSQKVVREEPFSAERLEQHARSVVVAQTVSAAQFANAREKRAMSSGRDQWRRRAYGVFLSAL